MTKKYKIDYNKNIGNVIFVVEGGRAESGGTELRLLKKIFADILGYEVQELRRGCDEFIGYGKSPSSRVFALNLPKNQLTQLSEDALDDLFKRLKSEFKIKPEDCPIFFIYDRDYLSYKHNELRGKYINRYTDPYSNDDGYQGQLLLNYPAVESYILSCFADNTYKLKFYLGKDIKNYIHTNGISDDNIKTDKHIIHATEEMDICLDAFDLSEYDLDDLASTLSKVYEIQQKSVENDNAFFSLSLISLALLELGVITEIDDT